MTIPEYELLMKANRLKQVDDDYRVHQLAFLNLAVKATRKSGKPIYTRFKKFFDYDKQIDKASGAKEKRLEGIGEFLKKGGINGD